jgi:hypothetical protein
MSIKRLNPEQAAAAIRANRQVEANHRQGKKDMAQIKLDKEDRGFYDGIGWMARLSLRRKRKFCALFIKQIVAQAHERGVINERQGSLLIRSSDNRLYPEGR